MRVSLIITTYNRPDALIQVLRSIEKQSTFPDEVIIADDGSDYSTKNCIENFTKSSMLNVIHSWQENKGFRVARSRNKAIAKSTCEYIILIDGDVILHNKFIEDHIKHSKLGFFIQGSRVLISQEVTMKTLSNNRNKFSFFSKGLSNRKNSIHSNLLSLIFMKKFKSIKGIKTCNFSFYKKDCIDINGFNNEIEGWGREDSEFVVRILNSGITRKNIPFNLIQFHLWHPHSSRTLLGKNDKILEDAIQSKLDWCEDGLNKFIK
jgi:glycosyltransferase involved in cell wall biosynthesis